MTIDVGTGDGRAVLATATTEPTTLAIGIDADAASMVESSRRAARSPRKGGLPNALFVVAAVEALPAELRGLADRVTVHFPWGSLLRGCLGEEPRVAEALAGLLRPSGMLQLLLAPADRDRLAGLPTRAPDVAAAVTAAFQPTCLRVIEARPATTAELHRSRSTWARRLVAAGIRARSTGAPEGAVRRAGTPNVSSASRDAALKRAITRSRNAAALPAALTAALPAALPVAGGVSAGRTAILVRLRS